MKCPDFSVIIPIYNAKATICWLLDEVFACLDELARPAEVIIINDGSTDNPIEYLRYYFCDHRLKLYHQRNAGPAAARNLGLERASGKYIFFLDDDDGISPDFFQALLEVQEEKDPTLALCGLKQNRKDSEPVLYYTAPPLEHKPGEKSREYLLRLLFQDGRLYPAVNKIFRRDIIEKYHLRFDPSLPLGEDLDFCLRYLKAALEEDPHFKLCCIAEPLYYYNYGGSGSTMESASRSKENWEKSYQALLAWADHPSLKERRLLRLIRLRWTASYLKARRRAA